MYRNLLDPYILTTKDKKKKSRKQFHSQFQQQQQKNIEVKNLFSENYEMLVIGTEDDTNRLNDMPHSWIGRIIIVKTTKLCKVTYRFDAISIKLPMAFFTELDRTKINTSCMKHKRLCIAKFLQ